jgi:hypothetical protein
MILLVNLLENKIENKTLLIDFVYLGFLYFASYVVLSPMFCHFVFCACPFVLQVLHRCKVESLFPSP